MTSYLHVFLTNSFAPSTMAPSSKAKAAGVSASSFLDLKSELAKHENDFLKNKAAGKEKYIVGGVKRPDKVGHIRP